LRWDAAEDRETIIRERFAAGPGLLVLDQIHKFSRWIGMLENLYMIFRIYPFGALNYAFVVADTGKIDAEHLPPQFAPGFGAAGGPAMTDSTPEREALIEALRRTNGNQTQAARLLGINRVTVCNRMRKHGIDLKKVPQT
jgi:transcriptional regulator of acetoin/glycerol metabolism